MDAGHQDYLVMIFSIDDAASLLLTQQELECYQQLRIEFSLFEKSQEDDRQSQMMVAIRREKKLSFVLQKLMEVILQLFCSKNEF